MDYQKHIRSSFARTEEEIRLGIAFAFRDFLISTEIHWMRQCRFAIQTKPCNSADRSHRNPPFLFARSCINLRQAFELKNRGTTFLLPRAILIRAERRAADFSIELPSLLSAILNIVMSLRNNFIAWNSEVESGGFIRIHLPSSKST